MCVQVYLAIQGTKLLQTQCYVEDVLNVNMIYKDKKIAIYSTLYSTLLSISMIAVSNPGSNYY